MAHENFDDFLISLRFFVFFFGDLMVMFQFARCVTNDQRFFFKIISTESGREGRPLCSGMVDGSGWGSLAARGCGT